MCETQLYMIRIHKWIVFTCLLLFFYQMVLYFYVICIMIYHVSCWTAETMFINCVVSYNAYTILNYVSQSCCNLVLRFWFLLNVMFETRLYMIGIHKWIVFTCLLLLDGFMFLCHIYHNFSSFMLNYCDCVYKLCCIWQDFMQNSPGWWVKSCLIFLIK